VLAAVGSHCPALTRLQLMGCHLVTDRGVSAAALLGGAGAGALRRLNLRGCKLLTDAAVFALAARAPGLVELCLSGIATLSPGAIAALIVRAKRLARFTAEVWSDAPGAPPDAADAAAAGAASPNDSHKTYRLLGSVRGAIRFIASVLPADDAAQADLAARYKADPPPFSASGSGMPLALPEPRGVEGAAAMTPPFQRRRDESFDDGAAHMDLLGGSLF